MGQWSRKPWMPVALGLLGVASLPGQIVFTDVGSSTNTTVICNTHGSGFFDYNNDGWDDIYVVHNTSMGGYINLDNTLLKNLGNNTFENVARAAGVAGYQIYSAQGLAAADCDNDGDADLCIGMGMYNRALFYKNSGNGYFTQRDAILDPNNLTFHGRNLAFLDYDNDGFVDLLFLRDSYDQNPDTNPMFVLFRNNRHGGFEDVTRQADLWNYKPGYNDLYGFAIADVNNDNYLDFYVPRYDAPSMLMMNNGNGTFSEAAAAHALPRDTLCLGAVFLDYNNDGYWDLFIKMHEPYKGRLFRNNGKDGNYTFTEVSHQAGVDIDMGWHNYDSGFGGGLTTGDFDDDGYTDILSISEWGQNTVLFRNWGNGAFLNIASWAGLTENYRYYWSAPAADYNHDGYLDVYMARSPGVPTYASLYKNRGGSNNWIQLWLAGVQSNRSAVGARLVLYANGKQQMRQIQGGDGYKVNSFTVHYGLGQAARMDSLYVYWPSGIVQKKMGFPVNRYFPITEDNSVEYYGNLHIAGNIRHAGSTFGMGGVGVRESGSTSGSVRTDASGYYQYHSILYNSTKLVMTPSRARWEEVGEGVLTSWDAARILRHLAGTETLSAERRKAADVDLNGNIDAQDAALIARNAAGMQPEEKSHVGEWGFLPESKTYSNIVQSYDNEDYQAYVRGDASGNWGSEDVFSGEPDRIVFPDSAAVYYNIESFEIPIKLADNSGVLSSDLRLKYDSKYVAFVKAQKANGISDFNCTVYEGVKGRVKISLYGSHPVTQKGTVLTLTFRKILFPESSTAIEWERIVLNDLNFRAKTTVIHGVDLSIFGQVLHEGGGRGIGGASVRLSGSMQDMFMTDSNGTYRFSSIPYGAANLAVKPEKPRWEDIGDGVLTSYDAALILRYLQGMEAFSAGKRMAADVDLSGTVDTLDAALIARFMTGETVESGFHGGEWLFLPESRTYSNVVHSFPHEDFEGDVRGDVSGNWGTAADTAGYSGGYLVADSITAYRNIETVEVPVSVGNYSDVCSADLRFTYDPACLELIKIQKADNASDYRLVYREETPGTVKLSLYGANPIPQNGTVLTLTFREIQYPVNPTIIEWNKISLNDRHFQKGRTVLHGVDLQISGQVWYMGWWGRGISRISVLMSGAIHDTFSTYSSGYYEFKPIPFGAANLVVKPEKARWADVGQGVVSSFDAAAVLRHLAGEGLSEAKLKAADADLNGTVDTQDAAAIARYSVGMLPDEISRVGEWFFSPENKTYANVVRSYTGEDYTGTVRGDVSGNWGIAADTAEANEGIFPDSVTVIRNSGTVDIPVSATGGFSFYSADIRLKYDTTAVEFIEVQKADFTQTHQILYHETEKGTVNTAFYCAHPLVRAGVFLIFRFRIPRTDIQETEIQWVQAVFDEQPFVRMKTRIIATDSSSSEVKERPIAKVNTFSLVGSYPNPFNPVVSIVYALDRSGEVCLSVFDVHGREVQRLAQARQNAGEYQIQWDGKERSGREVPSGVYFCRLISGDRAKILKMLKIR